MPNGNLKYITAYEKSPQNIKRTSKLFYQDSTITYTRTTKLQNLIYAYDSCVFSNTFNISVPTRLLLTTLLG